MAHVFAAPPTPSGAVPAPVAAVRTQAPIAGNRTHAARLGTTSTVRPSTASPRGVPPRNAQSRYARVASGLAAASTSSPANESTRPSTAIVAPPATAPRIHDSRSLEAVPARPPER